MGRFTETNCQELVTEFPTSSHWDREKAPPLRVVKGTVMISPYETPVPTSHPDG